MSNETVLRYGSPLAVNALVLQDGDEIQVKTRVNSNVWLHLFSIDQTGKVSQIYPNEYAEAELLLANREFVFPNEEQRAMGLNLRVSAKDATTITDLMKELSDLNPAFWIEKAWGMRCDGN